MFWRGSTKRSPGDATPAGADRFAAIDWEPGRGGVPLLTGALATLECEIVAEHAAGDHWIMVGRVEGLRRRPPANHSCSSTARSAHSGS